MGEAPMQTVQDVEQHVPVREGEYGERVATVEPGGVEYISLKERHGKPIDLFWTWLSPNLEFATIYVGILGVAVFVLSFWQSAFAIAFLIIVVAQVAIATLGHNFIHVFERWALPLLGIVFALATIYIFSKANFGAGVNIKAPVFVGEFGSFTLLFTATFGYAAGWNPYAADYTRYLPPTTNRTMVGLWAAMGVFVSCVVIELA